MLAARPHGLSPFVHAVEDGGAVCGARPRNGRWRLSTRLPLTCPGCLIALSLPRFAVCAVPEARARGRRFHVRQLGPAGFKPRGALDTLTLCGRTAGWDVEKIGPGTHLDDEVCTRCRAAYPEARASASRVAPAHAVR